MALVGAGFVAGRAPLGQPEPEQTLAVASPARLVAASGVLLAAVLIAWATWQPEAADRQTADAITLADAGDLDAAVAKTEDAADTNPLSSEPLIARAAIETEAGRLDEAREALERAVLRFPGESQTWIRLAAFQLGTLDHPREAAETVQGAIFLDPHSQASRVLYLQARARERELAAAGR
jgi:tetratricopeptide (TPR) repeat protein